MNWRKSAAVWVGTEAVRHFAGRDLQGREQVEDAVPPIVVRVAHRPAGAQRQGRLRALQRLNRGLLVDTEDDGVLGRLEVEPDDIGDLGGEGRIPTHFERPHEMRLQAVRAENVGDLAADVAAHGSQTDGRRRFGSHRRRGRTLAWCRSIPGRRCVFSCCDFSLTHRGSQRSFHVAEVSRHSRNTGEPLEQSGRSGMAAGHFRVRARQLTPQAIHGSDPVSDVPASAHLPGTGQAPRLRRTPSCRSR